MKTIFKTLPPQEDINLPEAGMVVVGKDVCPVEAGLPCTLSGTPIYFSAKRKAVWLDPQTKPNAHGIPGAQD